MSLGPGNGSYEASNRSDGAQLSGLEAGILSTRLFGEGGLMLGEGASGATPGTVKPSKPDSALGVAAADARAQAKNEEQEDFKRIIAVSKGIDFTSQQQNSASNVHPDFILLSDGTLKAVNPAPNTGGKINIQVEGLTSDNANILNSQEQKNLQMAASADFQRALNISQQQKDHARELITSFLNEHQRDADARSQIPEGWLRMLHADAPGRPAAAAGPIDAPADVKWPMPQSSTAPPAEPPDAQAPEAPQPSGAPDEGGGITASGATDDGGAAASGGAPDGGAAAPKPGAAPDAAAPAAAAGGDGITGSGSAEPIGPGEQAKAADIYKLLLARGFNAAQACGILGNMQTESGFDTGRQNYGEGAIGLCQWEGPRRTALEQFAGQQGKPVTDLNLQLDFMMKEFATTYSRAYADLKDADSPEQAAAVFQREYEQSRSLGDRPANARALMVAFAGDGGHRRTAVA